VNAALMVWDIDAMKKMFDEFKKENVKAQHVPYWIFENFRGYIKFGKLPKEKDALVKEIKGIRKNENLDKQSEQEVIVNVKESDNYLKHSSKKLAELIIKGEIRDMEAFKFNCEELKLDVDTVRNRVDKIVKQNKGKTSVQLLKEYTKADQMVKF
jgi:hypothetical protein